MQTTQPTTETVERMLQRGRTRMVQAVLYQSEIGNPQKMFDHWKGFASCAACLLSDAASVMALHDQASQPQSGVQAALARLPDHCERLSFAAMESLMRAQGVDFAPDAVANSNVDAVVQLKDAVSMVVMFDDKHAVAGVDVQDGGRVHGSPLVVETAILSQEGGAA